MSRGVDDKLEYVIHMWIESECSPVTWDNLTEILDRLGYIGVVNMIQSALIESREGSTDEEKSVSPSESNESTVLKETLEVNNLCRDKTEEINEKQQDDLEAEKRFTIQFSESVSSTESDEYTVPMKQQEHKDQFIEQIIHYKNLLEVEKKKTRGMVMEIEKLKEREKIGATDVDPEEYSPMKEDTAMNQQCKDQLKEQIMHYKNLLEVEQKKSQGMVMEIEKLKEREKIGATDVDPEEYSPMKEGTVPMKVQNKDQSMQFNYMTTVNDCLDNDAIHVGGETVYLIQGRSVQSFNWSEWGLRMHFLEDSLAIPPVGVVSSDPASTPPRCSEVAVKALIGGKFQFPQGSELVSAVYAISLANKLRKPVQLEIQHCAVLKSESQFKQLTFVKAPMRQRDPPFEFSPIEGGEFSIDSQWGSITLDHFSLIAVILMPAAVILRKLGNVLWNRYEHIQGGPAIISPANPEDAVVRDDADSDEFDLLYSVQLVYSRYGNRVNQWSVWFVAVKNLNALQTYIRKKHPNAEVGRLIPFSFNGNSRVLKLITADQKILCNGWTLYPDAYPLKMHQKQINKFGREADSVPEPSSCLIRATVSNPKTAEDLYYGVPIKGVVCDTEKIFINRLLERPSFLSPSLLKGICYGSFIASVVLIVLLAWIMMGYTGKLSNSNQLEQNSDDKSQFFIELLSDIPLNKDLGTFCVNLGLGLSNCDEIVLSNPGDFVVQKLGVVKLWGKKKPRTMEDFVIALDKTGYCATVKKLVEEHRLEYQSKKCTI